MSCMWVSVVDCSQAHLMHLTEMIREDSSLQIILSYGEPGTGKKEQEQIEKQIAGSLFDLGMPSHLKGYQYLKTALEICLENPDELDGITKRLYPTIARKFGTTADKVEHAIRHAVEAAWKRGDERMQKRVFGYSFTEGRRPTNMEFIVRLEEWLVRNSRRRFS